MPGSAFLSPISPPVPRMPSQSSIRHLARKLCGWPWWLLGVSAAWSLLYKSESWVVLSGLLRVTPRPLPGGGLDPDEG